jgi:ABC-2 type transport system ATP-binding protein
MIQVRGLAKRFGEHLAVDDLSFDVDAGESFGLFGPMGAGKTTAMHLLAGLLAPDTGTITIGELPDPTHKATRQQIGVATQTLSLYEELTAEQNARLFGRLYGIAGAKLDEHVAWALEFVGLTERRNDRVRGFMGGMARRLNLACALVHNPPVLLLDEPLEGVDPQSRLLLIENIRHLKAHGRTIVLSSHRFADAELLCDRVAVLAEGRILALDTVEDLIAGHAGPAQVTVEFAEAPADVPEDMPGSIDGTTWRFPAEDPLAYLSRLSAQGLQFVSVKIDAPGLESAFQSLTGREQRD